MILRRDPPTTTGDQSGSLSRAIEYRVLRAAFEAGVRAADAAAICEAVQRPNMRFVPVKTEQAQARLKRVQVLIETSEAKSPFDGVVVEGEDVTRT